MESSACCKKGKKTCAQDRFQKLNRYLKQARPGARKLHFKPGQIIYYKGHDSCGVFDVIKGGVGLIRSSRSSRCEAFPGSLLGLNHLLSETPNCATCIALNDVELVFYPKAEILHCLNSSDQEALL